MKNTNPNNSVYDITIRMFLLFTIVAWCLLVMLPFIHIMLWGIILALAFMPLHKSLSNLMGRKPKLASTIIVMISLAIIILPGIFFMDSIIEGVEEIRAAHQAGTLTIPPPSEKVKSWPVIGRKSLIFGLQEPVI